MADLQAWAGERSAALAGLMQARLDAGQVREGHGDLHLGNVVWADGAPVLFDALEFNDSLRHIDTIGELAFTFMDLQAQGQPRLAWSSVSRTPVLMPTIRSFLIDKQFLMARISYRSPATMTNEAAGEG